jgi:hypothetical protein
MWQKEKFLQLNYQQKRQKVLLFLKNLKTDDKIIIWIIQVIESHLNISEVFLKDTYFDLLDFADLVKSDNDRLVVEKIQKSTKRIKDISIQEQKEKDDADQILDQI